MTQGREPTYALGTVQALIRAETYFIRQEALTGAWALGLDRYDIADCVLSLDENAFFKTMPAIKRPGLMQDVYKTSYLGVRIYLKVQIDAAMLVVVQFKEE